MRGGRQTDRLTFPECPPRPDVLEPHSKPAAKCSQLHLIHLTLGLGLGRNPGEQPAALHPAQTVSASLLWSGVHRSASPGPRFPVKMSVFTPKPWDSPQAAMPFLTLPLLSLPFPCLSQDPFSSHILSLPFSPESLFPATEVLSA